MTVIHGTLLDISGLNIRFPKGNARKDAGNKDAGNKDAGDGAGNTKDPSHLTVVSRASLTLRRGEFAALVGESGSGKTLLTRALGRLLPQNAEVTADRLLFNDLCLITTKPETVNALRGRKIAYIFQEPLSSMNPSLKIGRQLMEPLEIDRSLSPAQRRRLAIDILTKVQIRDPEGCLDCYPHELSGGMRQRVMIAAALIGRPSLIVADEPTTALDLLVQKETLALMRDVARDVGAAVLLVTHDLSVVADFAETVHVMESGRIVEQGPVKDIFSNPQHPYTRKLLDAIPTAAQDSAPPTATDVVLTVNNISVTFQGPRKWAIGPRQTTTVLDDVSLSLAKGETLAIIGESGSGKTTLSRTIAGLIPVSRGTILLHGRPLQTLPAKARKLQFIFQDPVGALDPRMTVAAIIGEALLFSDIPKQQRQNRITQALHHVGLDPALATRLPHQLSGGQRQRVNIARAIVSEPSLIIADEPISALDLTVQKQILDLFLDLKTRLQFSCLFVSHDLGVVEHLADRVCVLYRGKIVELDSREAIFNTPQHPYTRQLIAATPIVERTRTGGYVLSPRTLACLSNPSLA